MQPRVSLTVSNTSELTLIGYRPYVLHANGDRKLFCRLLSIAIAIKGFSAGTAGLTSERKQCNFRDGTRRILQFTVLAFRLHGLLTRDA